MWARQAAGNADKDTASAGAELRDDLEKTATPAERAQADGLDRYWAGTACTWTQIYPDQPR